MKILVINGANLNKLGSRWPEYGRVTLTEIEKDLAELAKELEVEIAFFTSNCEGEIVNAIQDTDAEGIIINAGAYTHYSYAIADALRDKPCRTIEVHLTNIFDREEFRNRSVLSPCTSGVVAGFGRHSYTAALRLMKELVQESEWLPYREKNGKIRQ